MDSKAEFKGFKLTRLKVESSKWDTLKEVEGDEKLDQWEEAQMLALGAKNPTVRPQNNVSNYRKRKSGMQTNSDAVCGGPEPSPVPKRRKSCELQDAAKTPTTVKSSRGS